MKLKILSCLLAASTMFSMQACTLINETLELVSAGNFGRETNRDVCYVLEGVVAEVVLGALLNIYQACGQPFDVMTVYVKGNPYHFRNLSADTEITFHYDNQGAITYTRFDPFTIVNRSSQTITVSKLGEVGPIELGYGGGIFKTKACTQVKTLTITYGQNKEQVVDFPGPVQWVTICDGMGKKAFSIQSGVYR